MHLQIVKRNRLLEKMESGFAAGVSMVTGFDIEFFSAFIKDTFLPVHLSRKKLF